MNPDVLYSHDRTRSFRTGCDRDTTSILQGAIDALTKERADALYLVLYRRLSIHD